MNGINPRLQGQSAIATEAKERGLSAAFTVNLRIFQAKFGRDPRACYVHVDLNAGSGMNDQVGCLGSPLTFLGAARAVGVERYRALFCDIAEPTIKTLLARPDIMDDSDRSYVIHGDNASLCNAIAAIVRAFGERPQYVIGSVLVDPNGTDVPIDALAELAKACPRLDIFVNVAATALKRNQQNGAIVLSDIPLFVRKRQWLIRVPIGQWGWVMLLGRNFEVSEHAALGFYDLRSSKGQEILELCELTRGQRKLQQNATQLGLL